MPSVFDKIANKCSTISTLSAIHEALSDTNDLGGLMR